REPFLAAAQQGEGAARQFLKEAKLDPNVAEELVAVGQRGTEAARQIRAVLPVLEAARAKFDAAIREDPVLGNNALADHFVALDRTDKALEALAEAREIDKFDPRAYHREARIRRRQGMPEMAAAALREGLAAVEGAAATKPAKEQRVLIPSRVNLSTVLASVLLDMVETGHDGRDKLLEEARECLRKMTVLGLRGPRRDATAGRIAHAEGKTREALPLLENAFAKSKFDIRMANLLINIYLKQGLPGKAEGILDRLLKTAGQRENISAMVLKARLLMRYRDFGRAEQWIDRARKIDPKDPKALAVKMEIQAIRGEQPVLPPGLRPSSQTLRVLLDRAAGLWQEGRKDEAVRYVEQLYEQAPKSRAVIGRLAQMYRLLKRTEDVDRLLGEWQKHYPDDRSLVALKRLAGEPDKAKQRQIMLELADELPPLQRELEKANIEAMFDDMEAYKRHLLAASKIEPDAPGVVERLFRYALAEKDWKVAQECVERATAANLDASGGKLFQAHLAKARNDADGTIAAALEVLRDAPDRKVARVLLGEAYLRKKLYDQAYDAFRMVWDNDPAYAPALKGLVFVTKIQGKEEERRSYVKAAYRLIPQDRHIREEMARIEELESNPQKVIARREATLRRSPDDLLNVHSLGMLYERVEDFEKAEQMYLALHKKSPDQIYSARALCRFYLRRSRPGEISAIVEPLLHTAKDKVAARILYGELMTSIDRRKAEGLLQSAVDAEKKDPRGHRALAQFRALAGDWTGAREAMLAYVRLRPEDRAGEKELVRYHIGAGEHGPALQRLEEILRRDPGDAGALTLKGELAFSQGQTKTAESLLTQAIHDNPTYSHPLILRARLYLAQGDSSKAKADLEKARDLTNRIDVAMQLGAVYVLLQDYDNAELVFRQVRVDSRRYVPAIDYLVRIYIRRQKWPQLEKLLAEVQPLFPKGPKYLLDEAEMWRVRENVPRRLAVLAKAVEVSPSKAGRALQRYLHALQQANRHEQVVLVTEGYLSDPIFIQWGWPIRACALAKLGRNASAEKLFLDSLETVQAPYVLLIAQQLREAYGAEAGAAKLKAWIAQRAANWRLHL
ncbi:MAG: tetratricopeptide repeat protein, partial [Planctomycetota bacterium]